MSEMQVMPVIASLYANVWAPLSWHDTNRIAVLAACSMSFRTQ